MEHLWLVDIGADGTELLIRIDFVYLYQSLDTALITWFTKLPSSKNIMNRFSQVQFKICFQTLILIKTIEQAGFRNLMYTISESVRIATTRCVGDLVH